MSARFTCSAKLHRPSMPMLPRALPLLGLSLLSACDEGSLPMPVRYAEGVPRQSQTLQLDAKGQLLAVVNPDADSLSLLSVGDPQARKLLQELQLEPRPQQTAEGHFLPKCGPRGVDLSADGKTAYVVCQWSGQLLTVDTQTGARKQALWLGAEPVSVLVHPDGQALYVALYQSREVVRLPLEQDLPQEAQATRQTTTSRPFGLALDGAGQTLYVSRFLLQPGVDVLSAQTLAVQQRHDLPEVASRGNKLLAHGVPRGVYSATVRPGSSGELWLPHLLLATDIAQPDLDFESTVFPAVSIDSPGSAPVTLSTDSRLPKVDGALADIVSGPRAVAFTPDGGLALMVNMSSEDVTVLDASRRIQAELVRPLPGDLPEGIVVSPDGRFAYVDQRASSDVAVLSIAADWATRSSGRVSVDGPALPRLATPDPMPAQQRLGQRLFYSANSAEFPMTKNFWVACASCHLEGRSDAVTWLFKQGPRDTPSNAGGTLGTGFLLRTAGRNLLAQYDETIRVEQGGTLDLTRPADRKLLDALTAYVDHAIPLPKSPEVDARTGTPSAAAGRGQAVFTRLGCNTCHSGPKLTDSGAGNPSLDLTGQLGPVLLHDVGSCATGTFPDKATPAYDGSARTACDFDTPSLLGVNDTAPYMHDGSLATLEDVIDYFVRTLKLPVPSAQDRADLAAYLRSL